MTKRTNITFKILGTIIGALSGYAYWYFIGCQEGCTIQSVWWRMTLWGTVMGYLLVNIALDFFNTKKEKQ